MLDVLDKLKRELMRLRGEIVLLLIAAVVFTTFGISRANFENIVYKLALLALASMAVHVSRQLIFDYVCLEDVINGENGWNNVPVPIRCVVTAGIMFMYPVLVYAIMIAG